MDIGRPFSATSYSNIFQTYVGFVKFSYIISNDNVRRLRQRNLAGMVATGSCHGSAALPTTDPGHVRLRGAVRRAPAGRAAHRALAVRALRAPMSCAYRHGRAMDR